MPEFEWKTAIINIYFNIRKNCPSFLSPWGHEGSIIRTETTLVYTTFGKFMTLPA